MSEISSYRIAEVKLIAAQQQIRQAREAIGDEATAARQRLVNLAEAILRREEVFAQYHQGVANAQQIQDVQYQLKHALNDVLETGIGK